MKRSKLRKPWTPFEHSLRRERRLRSHVIEALRDLARQRCRPHNCGTVCLCPPCAARAALSDLDPGNYNA